MTNTLDLVVAELAALDAARPRSRQTEPGASQAGSCRAHLLLRTTGAEPTDRRLNFATLTGTALHAVAEQAADWDTAEVERSYEYRGVRCTVDRYEIARETVTDLKSKSTPEKVAEVRSKGPSRRQVWQVMLQAAALIAAGKPVKTVELLFFPRSGGTVDDCYLWTGEFDQAVADEAADWMAAEHDRAARYDGPAGSEDLHGLRDEPFFFCVQTCEFFTLCRGAEAMPSDDDYADAAARFADANMRVKLAVEDKRAAAADLAGFTGLAGGMTVRQVAPSESYVLDTDAIKARAGDWLALFGEDLPTKLSVRSGYTTVRPVRA